MSADTDDAPAEVVLAEVARCAATWQGSARIIGNVRAQDIVAACLDGVSLRSRLAEAERKEESDDAEWRESLGKEAARAEHWKAEAERLRASEAAYITSSAQAEAEIARLTKVRDEWKSRTAALMGSLAKAQQERDEARKALRENFCPRPCNHRPDQFDVGDCVDAGECGCMNRAALAPAQTEGE